MYVLLIEPDTILASVYRRGFEEAGWQVGIATTAQQAVTMADTKVPDVVILEPLMARHNGVEFLYEFRSYPEWQGVPILLHSRGPVGSFGDPDRLRRDLGVSGVMSKQTTTLADLVAAAAGAAA